MLSVVALQYTSNLFGGLVDGTCHIAIDLGASSLRITPVVVSAERVQPGGSLRFANSAVSRHGWRWDTATLHSQVLAGLAQLCAEHQPVSVSVDAWGVDYAWLTPGGELLDEPYSYRDPRTDRLSGRFDVAAVYRATGIPCQAINTSTQLLADRAVRRGGAPHRLMFIPDLINWMLTGQLRTELSIASTSQLVDAVSGDWSEQMIKELEIDRDCLPPIDPTGTITELRSSVVRRIGAAPSVVSVASHDTASAVLATPMLEGNSAYISLGTWACVGVERDQPVLTDSAASSGLTNERGLDGSYTIHRGAMGLWLLQQCLAEWPGSTAADLLDRAADLGSSARIDVDDPSLVRPGEMTPRISALCRRTGTAEPHTPVEFVRCIVDSLAASYARDLDRIEQVLRTKIDRVHIVGGGSRSSTICQSVADASGRTVIAGPAEATTIGNALAQARSFDGPVEVSELRRLVARSFDLSQYLPH